MKLTLFLYIIFLTLRLSTTTSIVKSSSSTENLKQSLYQHLNPILENTLEQLKELVNGFAKKISQSHQNRFTRSNPSDWVSDLFEGSDSITNQWNNHINEFFEKIPTVYENRDRSILNYGFISNKLHPAVKNLVQKLRNLFDTEINRVIIPTIKQLSKSNTVQVDLNQYLRDFQGKISHVFDNTEERLNQTIDNFFQSISNYLNQLKDRFLG